MLNEQELMEGFAEHVVAGLLGQEFLMGLTEEGRMALVVPVARAFAEHEPTVDRAKRVVGLFETIETLDPQACIEAWNVMACKSLRHAEIIHREIVGLRKFRDAMTQRISG